MTLSGGAVAGMAIAVAVVVSSITLLAMFEYDKRWKNRPENLPERRKIPGRFRWAGETDMKEEPMDWASLEEILDPAKDLLQRLENFAARFIREPTAMDAAEVDRIEGYLTEFGHDDPDFQTRKLAILLGTGCGSTRKAMRSRLIAMAILSAISLDTNGGQSLLPCEFVQVSQLIQNDLPHEVPNADWAIVYAKWRVRSMELLVPEKFANYPIYKINCDRIHNLLTSILTPYAALNDSTLSTDLYALLDHTARVGAKIAGCPVQIKYDFHHLAPQSRIVCVAEFTPKEKFDPMKQRDLIYHPAILLETSYIGEPYRTPVVAQKAKTKYYGWRDGWVLASETSTVEMAERRANGVKEKGIIVAFTRCIERLTARVEGTNTRLEAILEEAREANLSAAAAAAPNGNRTIEGTTATEGTMAVRVTGAA